MTKQNIKLKYARMFEQDNKCFLKLVYGYETDIGFYEFVLPKIDLGISSNRLPAISTKPEHLYPGMSFDETFVTFADKEFRLHAADVKYTDLGETTWTKNVYYVDTLTEEKVHKMTLSEIEAALGYKIELVGEK